MTKAKAQKIFEKHNPACAITRCPNGRSGVRKLLDTYAKSAMNLYGIISKVEFVEIFNCQNTKQTTKDEVFTLLLPLILKSKNYCFYKDYIVHYWAIDDFEYADYWIKAQGNKPRFIPEKDEFLKFESAYYKSETQELYWKELREFIFNEWQDNIHRYPFYNILKDASDFGANLQKVSRLLEEHGLVFSGEKQAQTFFNLYTEACNNTRLWSNKGYTPNELRKIMDSMRPKNIPQEIVMQERRKMGANDPCPCGSGKKYKKCCRLTENAKKAQLSYSECRLFYETWYGLMGFINQSEKIINANIKPVYPNPIDDENIYKVREALWGNPRFIDDYLESVTLPEEKVLLLKSWRNCFVKQMFFLVDYTPEYAIVIGNNEQKEDRLYGVKGISRSLADSMQRELPTQLETVLLPFKDKIIYDSFISTIPIGFAAGAKQAFKEMYENALVHGIITSLK